MDLKMKNRITLFIFLAATLLLLSSCSPAAIPADELVENTLPQAEPADFFDDTSSDTSADGEATEKRALPQP